MNRGEAHDWIARHGGNPRLADEVLPSATSLNPTDQNDDDAGAPVLGEETV